MGQITNATQGKALAKANPAGDFKGILAANWHKIAAVMPKHMSEDRMFQLAMSAYNSTPQLAECSGILTKQIRAMSKKERSSRCELQ